MFNSTLPLVLIPGMMCDQRLFAHQLTAFQSDRDVLVVHANHGSSMEAIANDVFNQIPWKRFALAGLSMGGIIAMEMARQHPERIAGLALMDTNPWAESAEIQATRTPQIEMALEGRHLEVIQHQMAPKYGGSDTEQEAQLSLVLAMAQDLGQDVFIQQSLALRNRQDQSESLKNFTGNSITLCGEFDQLCPLNRHQAIAAMMPNCQLHVIPNAGHLITWQAPQATNNHLENWLENLI
ncbi:alpha/beta fold hydrolase [Marinomonas algicola]|uniref:alpha/beta fold hydrolase n=1 Tax=Marinomonas algicola TaxID=2773454 RepID=UPI0019D57A76|nr:alpha/beta hydrolase [Marinomonas algicola]